MFETFRARRTERRAALDRRHRGRRLDPAADPHARRAQAPRRRGIRRHGRGLSEGIPGQFGHRGATGRPQSHRHPRVQLGELDLGQHASARPAAPASISITSTTRRRNRSSATAAIFRATSARFTPPKFLTCSRRSMPGPGRGGTRTASCPTRWPRTGSTSPPREIRTAPGLPAWPRFDPQQPTHLASSTTASASAPCPTWRRSQFWTAFDQQIRRNATA